MTILFAETTFINSSQDAHVRNCEILTEFLKSRGHRVFFVGVENIAQFSRTDLDAIIVSYGTFFYDTADLERVITDNPQAKLYWMTNEYNLKFNGGLRKHFKARKSKIITNFDNDTAKIDKCFREKFSLNLNLLLFVPQPINTEKKYEICYYGTFRQGRAKYFKKYFTNGDFVLSSSKQNFKKFKSLGCQFRAVDKFAWKPRPTLRLFKYSLYIEDEYTHSHFNNLSNRFYEALSCGVVVLFDKSCENTLKRSEIANLGYEDFIIDGNLDLSERNYDEDLRKQQKWVEVCTRQRAKMLDDFERILTGK